MVATIRWLQLLAVLLLGISMGALVSHAVRDEEPVRRFTVAHSVDCWYYKYDVTTGDTWAMMTYESEYFPTMKWVKIAD